MSSVDRYINNTGSTICPTSLVTENLKELLHDSTLLLLKRDGREYITQKIMYELETEIAERLIGRLQTEECGDLSELIARYESMEGKILNCDYKLAKKQKEGVTTLLSSKTAIVTGGPGTGKTSVLKCVAKIIEWTHPGSRICFLAPTGKAARRIKESSGYYAQTIQRKIGDAGDSTQQLSLICDDYVIVDEVSMLDLPTFRNLLKCLSPATRLFLVGDVDQLPSVGHGAVLRDLIDSKIIPVCQLERVFRQKAGSTLADNIEIIKKGMWLPFIEGTDFVKSENVSGLLDIYYDNVKEWGIDNTVILTPNRKVGEYCSEKLNAQIQSALNGKRTGLSTVVVRDGRKLPITFKVGDPVMQLVNREVANGDVGKVIRTTTASVTVQYYDCTVTYAEEELWQLDLAYAISIHKSQGSEYPSAIVLCEGNLDRNMVYTAVTRAKKKCTVIGNEAKIAEACKKQSNWSRDTFLCTLLEIKYMAKMIIDSIS